MFALAPLLLLPALASTPAVPGPAAAGPGDATDATTGFPPELLSIPRSGQASAATPKVAYGGVPFPPPGSQADQELVKGLLQAQAGITSERSIAVQTTQRLGRAGLDAKLAALQATQPAEAAQRTADLRARLHVTWARVADVVSAKWPVDPRLGCRQQGLELQSAMAVAPGAPEPPKAAGARGTARACLDRELLVLRPLERANGELPAVLGEVRTALASAPPTAGSRAPLPPAGKAN